METRRLFSLFSMTLPYQEGFSVSHSKTCTREDIAQLLKHAPPEMRQAVYALFLSAKKSLDLGYHPEVRATPIKGWRCLLQLLASVAAMQTETEALLRVTSDLVAIADHMAVPSEVLRQSAEILVHALHADLYVCRMRSEDGEWVVQAAARADGAAIPIVAPMMEESLIRHPVMRVIQEGHGRYVVSNDLHGLERGGDLRCRDRAEHAPVLSRADGEGDLFPIELFCLLSEHLFRDRSHRLPRRLRASHADLHHIFRRKRGKSDGKALFAGI